MKLKINAAKSKQGMPFCTEVPLSLDPVFDVRDCPVKDSKTVITLNSGWYHYITKKSNINKKYMQQLEKDMNDALLRGFNAIDKEVAAVKKKYELESYRDKSPWFQKTKK